MSEKIKFNKSDVVAMLVSSEQIQVLLESGELIAYYQEGQELSAEHRGDDIAQAVAACVPAVQDGSYDAASCMLTAKLGSSKVVADAAVAVIYYLLHGVPGEATDRYRREAMH